jgi:serine/threonine protein kinase
VHHRDLSPSNVMGYRFGGRFMSVLSDFDLSSIKDAPKDPERTGTVPFMSLHLLVPEAIVGQVEHVYYHDAESFGENLNTNANINLYDNINSVLHVATAAASVCSDFKLRLLGLDIHFSLP